MSVERVREYFEKAGIAERIQEFDISSATVSLAAQALNFFSACGSSNSAIELTVEELEKYSGYKNWVDVCKK